jgi:O-antigen ligase
MFGLWILGLSFSRGAWLGLAAGGLAGLVLIRRARLRLPWQRLFISGTFLLSTGLLFVAIYQPFLLARSGVSPESIEQRSVSDRLVFTEFALRAIGEQPIGGVGVGNFPWRASFYLMSTEFDLLGDNVHNIYLSVWAELGTIGLALYVGAIASGLWAALRQARDLPHIALIAMVLTLLVIGLLDHYPYSVLHFQMALWALLALSGAHSDGA